MSMMEQRQTGIFGGSLAWQDLDETEMGKLRRELAEALAKIDRLKDALGSNHPLGRSHGLFG
jgi:hypothetical protein